MHEHWTNGTLQHYGTKKIMTTDKTW